MGILRSITRVSNGHAYRAKYSCSRWTYFVVSLAYRTGTKSVHESHAVVRMIIWIKYKPCQEYDVAYTRRSSRRLAKAILLFCRALRSIGKVQSSAISYVVYSSRPPDEDKSRWCALRLRACVCLCPAVSQRHFRHYESLVEYGSESFAGTYLLDASLSGFGRDV